MQEHNQNISRAARQLQIRRQTLQYKLRILKDE
jgi:DNA-binding PucR family transcriptional regulator